jgi:hypothetical protein
MARPVLKKVRSFALRLETLEKIIAVTEEAKLAGGASGLVQDALDRWFTRYDADPAGWLAARGIAHTKPPVEDDL